ncbi:hypothetical protein [Streptomyces sp. NBC_01361]|uniref:hypothetical protein n=1 Tax=Streptomyces sp. NBC_01361 TaxID=2903838 RepID=UPI002E335BCB|nr:hypothetical protein [Streptomyces sp. NBC_01361]
MSLLPRTFYVVGCDSCGTTYYVQNLEDDTEDELTLATSELPESWARCMTSEGWIATTRHLCPNCVKARGDSFIERLELERTHMPLFDLPVRRPAKGEGTDPS